MKSLYLSPQTFACDGRFFYVGYTPYPIKEFINEDIGVSSTIRRRIVYLDINNYLINITWSSYTFSSNQNDQNPFTEYPTTVEVYISGNGDKDSYSRSHINILGFAIILRHCERKYLSFNKF